MANLKIDPTVLASLAKINTSRIKHDLDIRIVYWGFYDVNEWDYPNINQPDWIVYWNATEGQSLNVNGVTLKPSPNFIYVFPPFTRYGGIRVKNFIQFFMHFNILGEKFRVKNEMLMFPCGNYPDLILQAARATSGLRQLIILKGIAYSILKQIPDTALASIYEHDFDERIRKAVEIIEANPAAPHSIAELSAQVNMSINNFHRRFLAETDLTPKQYILRRRLEYASQLLLATQLGIDAIALKSGFQNRYHFSKAFKHYFLFSPIAYKKMNLNHLA